MSLGRMTGSKSPLRRSVGRASALKPWPLLPEQRKQTPNGDVDLFNATIGFRVVCPAHQSSAARGWERPTTFHGIMDDTYRTGELIPHKNVRYAFTPHMNHRFTPEFAVTRPLWIDQHLKGNFTFPANPRVEAGVVHRRWRPRFQFTPDRFVAD